NLASVQIISHGDEGRVQLGNTVLSSETLPQYQAQLQQWGAALSESGDILLYGCRVAAGTGQVFVEQLSQLTGADVAASDDLTGNAALGGDWQLEVQKGEITVSPAVSAEQLEAYQGILREVGQGLLGHYFNNQSREGEPTVVRIDSDFVRDWGLGNPTDGGQGLDQWDFSAKWQGAIIPPKTGWYYFEGYADDWFYLDINKEGNWQTVIPRSQLTRKSGSIYLQENASYLISFGFEDKGGNAAIELKWKPPGSSNYSEIPSQHLLPDTDRSSTYIRTSASRIGIEAVEASESSGKAIFEVNSSQIPSHFGGEEGVEVYYQYSSSKNSTIRSGNVTITNTTQRIEIPIDDDSVYDPDETLTVSLVPGAYLIDSQNDSATVNIEDNEPIFSIERVGDGTATEGGENPQFKIRAMGEAPNENYELKYRIEHISSSNQDFQAVEGTVIFPEGETGALSYNIQLNDDQEVESFQSSGDGGYEISPEEFRVRLIEDSGPSYGVAEEITDTYRIADNEPRLIINKLADKTEGEDARIRDIFEIRLAKPGDDTTFQASPQDFKLNLDITGDAVRESFTNTQAGSDYKLFYTAYGADNSEKQSRQALPDPEPGQTRYEINVPKDTAYIRLQVEDIDDELYEQFPEDITISIVDGDSYAVRERTETASLVDNEPLVSLGEVVNPTEGLGFGSTIAGLEEAIIFSNGEFLSVADSANLNLSSTGEFTQEAWIFTNFTDSDRHGILGFDTGGAQAYPSISVIDETSIEIGFGDGNSWHSRIVEDVITPNAWNHVATTFDGTDYKLYINAVEVFSTSDFAGKSLAPTQQLEIGKAGSSYFEGAIDEVRIWNAARSAGEIQRFMVSQLESYEKGLVGYWNFNGNSQDQSLKENQSNSAGDDLWFDGRNDYAEVPNHAALNIENAITIEAKVYLDEDTPSGNRRILQKGSNDDQYRLLIEDGRLKFDLAKVGSVTAALSPSFRGRQWHHVAGVYDGSELTLYIDGVEVASVTASGSISTTANPLNIGTKNPQAPAGDFWKGQLDEVRIWNTARNAAQISANRDRELAGNEEGLVAYYKVQNDDGKTLKDYSSNEKNGELMVGPGQYINNPAPQIGYVEVNLDKPFRGAQGLWVKYDITGGNANQNEDYFNSRYRKVSTDASSERNGIIIPQGETSGRIYFSAISDAIAEGDETVGIRLVPHNFDDEANSSSTNSNYGIGATNTATITIKDNQAFKNGIILLDEKDQIIGGKNPLVIRNGQANFKVQLSSQPTGDVTVDVGINSTDSTSLTFSAANWDQPQNVTFSEISTSGSITASASRQYLSDSLTFDFTVDPPLRVTEGSAADAAPVIPEVTIFSQGNIKEDGSLPGNFTVNLSAPAPAGGLEVKYEVTGEATPGQDYLRPSSDDSSAGAFRFDGVDDYVSLPTFDVSGAITIESWIYVEEHQKWSTIVDLGNGAAKDNIYFSFSGDTGRLQIRSYREDGKAGWMTAPDPIPTQQWVHVAATIADDGLASLYIDGKLVRSFDIGTAPHSTPRQNTYIGRSGWGGDKYFNGRIRDVRIWDTARSQEEIQGSKGTHLQGDEAGLIAYYKGDSAPGNLVPDSSANSKNGELKNGASYAPLEIGTLIIPEGETSGVIPILPIANDVSEADETVSITIIGGEDYVVSENNSSATLNILDDDQAGIKVVNVQTTIGEDDLTIISYTDSFVPIVTSEPHSRVGNIVELIDIDGNVLGSATVSEADIAAGQITLTVVENLPDDVKSLRANLKEVAAGNLGAVINNDNITLSGGAVAIKLPGNSYQSTVGIRLQTEPNANVTVSLVNIDETETSLDKTTLTFTPENWDTYQQVIISGIDDAVDDGDISYQIKAEVTASEDPNYQGKIFSIDGQNLDDDRPLDYEGIKPAAPAADRPYASIGAGTSVIENEEIVQIQVNLSKPAAQTTNVLFNITDGSASINQDYQPLQKVFIEQTGANGAKRFAGPFDGVDSLGGTSKVAFADLDQDDDLDAIIGTPTGLRYYENTGSTSLPVLESKTGIHAPFSSSDVAGTSPTLGDLNGDGKVDLVVGTETGDLVYYVNTSSLGKLRFQRSSELGNSIHKDPFSGINGGSNASPFLVDFDGDTDLDLIVGSENALRYYENTGSKVSATFAERPESAISKIEIGQNVSPFVVDWDRDGDLDLLLGQADGSVRLFSAEDSGYTSPEQIIQLANGTAASPTFADLDDDGDLDAFVGDAGGKINYYEQFSAVQFAAGEQTKTIDLKIKEDQVAEGDETLGISLAANAGYQLGSGEVILSFDGQDDYVEVAHTDALNVTDAMTVEARIYLDEASPSGDRRIVQKGGNDDQYRLLIENNQLKFHLSGVGEVSTAVPASEEWHHVAAVYDGSKLTLYVNGQEANSVAASGQIHTTTDPLFIGAGNSGSPSENLWKGQLDEIRIWNVARTPAEIAASQEQNLSISEPGLVAYYQGNANSDNAIVDSSLYGHNGKLHNGAASRNDFTTTVTIVDDDRAGVVITPEIGGSGKTSEAGNSVSYRVKLDTQPMAPVTVYLGTQDESEGLVTTESDLSALSEVVSLEFTPENWNREQTFYVKGVDEQVADGDLAYQIITTVVSEDRQYHRLPVDDLSLVNTDDDQVGVVITGAGKAVEGRENVYSVRLKSQPVGEVRLIATPTNDQIRLNNELTGEPHTLTFNSDNWNLDQTVRATALDDSVVEYLHTSEISFRVETGESLNFESKADNSTPDGALDLGAIAGGYTWNNLTISPDGDVDWFKFTIPDTGNIRDFAQIKFDHASGDLQLELYQASDLATPIQVANRSSSGENFEQISLDGQPFGEYYLKVSSSSNSPNPIRYDLLIADEDHQYTHSDIVLEPLPVVIEDNDIPTVNVIAGPTASEVFGQPSYFTFQLNAPAPANGDGIKVNYQVVKDAGTATFPEDANGNGVLDPGEDRNGNGTLDLGDYQVQSQGFVHIAPGDIQNNLIIVPVDDKLVEDLNLKVTGVEEIGNELKLTVTTSLKDAQQITESVGEGNEDLAASNGTKGVLLANDSVAGEIKSGGDRDRFAVYLEAGVSYTFDLEGSPTDKGTLSDPSFYLYDGNGTKVGSNDDAASGNSNSRLTYTPTVSGVFYAEAAGYNDSKSGSYQLSLARNNSSEITENRNEGSWGNLPQNSDGSILVNGTVSGEINTSGDRDRFAVYLERGLSYTFDLEGSPTNKGTLSDPLFRLYDSSGNQVSLNDDGGESVNSRLTYTPITTGIFYAEAAGYNDSRTGSYQLTLTSGSIPFPSTNLPENVAITESTQIKFADDLVATVKQVGILEETSSIGNTRVYEGEITVEIDPSRRSEITAGVEGRIAEETVVIELLEGEGYQLPNNVRATLSIQDDDVPGVRIVQVGDNTVVRERETSAFQVSLLSEPTDDVTIRLTPGAEIEFVNPVNSTTVQVDKDVYSFGEVNTGNLEVKLDSLVTSEKGKTIAFEIKLQEKPSRDVIVELYDSNDPSGENAAATLKFTATEENLVLGKQEGNWDQAQQVIIGNLDSNTNGDLALKAIIKDAETKLPIGAEVNLPIDHTTIKVDKKTTEITISPDRWFQLQTVTITGVDEAIAEPGLYHQSGITYEVRSNDADYNNIFVPQQRIDVVDRILDAESTAQTVQQGLSALQNSLDFLEIPLIGKLDGKMPNLIKDISDKLVALIGGEQNLSTNRLKTLIEKGLKDSLGLDFLDVSVDMTEDNISLLLDVSKTYELFSLPLDADLGLDSLGIGLKTEGELKSEFDFKVALGFGLHKNFGFYLDTEETAVEAAIKLNLDDFEAQGNLGFLRLDMEDDSDNPTELEIAFKAGLNDLDNYQSVKFLDVNGDHLLDADSFTYPIRNPGKDPDPENREIQEPFTAVNATGQADTFPSVADAPEKAKRVNANGNNSFDVAKDIKNEGVYLVKKGENGQSERYYFDFNRNGKLDESSKESLFSVTSSTTKWFDKQGKVKPFRIEEKKQSGVTSYYFDQNGNGQLNQGETLTKQEKAKLDKNNNGRLDADVKVEGEGTFVQGTGIAFRDENKNGKLDVGESYVNSGFSTLSISDDALTEVSFLDSNGDGELTVDDATDPDEPSVKEHTDDEGETIKYLDLDGDDEKDDDEEPISKDGKWVIGDQEYEDADKIVTIKFLDLNNDGELTEDDEEDSDEPIVREHTSDGDETIEYLDLNGNENKDDGEPISEDDSWEIDEEFVKTYKIVTDSGRTFLDQDEDDAYSPDEDIDLSDADAVSALQLTESNGQIIDAQVTFIDLNGDGRLNFDEQDPTELVEPLVLTKQGVRFVDLDGNGSLTLDDDEEEKREPFSEQNNEFDEDALEGEGEIIEFLNDGDRLTLTELQNWKNSKDLGFSDLFTYEFAGTANLGLATKTSVEGDPAFPSVSFDLGVGLPLFNYGNQEEAGDTGLSVEFNDIKLDAGTFLTKLAAPVIETVNEIISPVKPILDVLNADTKIFSYLGLEDDFNQDSIPGVSIIDIASTLAEGINPNTTDKTLKRIKESVPKAKAFIGTVTQIVETVDKLKKLTESGESLVLDLGSYDLDDFKAASDDPADSAAKVDPTTRGTQKPAAGGTLSDQAQNSTTATPEQKSALDKLKSLEGLEIPILDDPVTLIRILLGEPNVDLIKYDIPDLEFYFGKSQEFPLWTPPTISGLLELSFEAKTDLSVGYDTGGLEAWKESDFDLIDIYKILDGFYLDDWDSDGEEKDELSATAKIVAGLSASAVVAKATLQGGLEGYLGFDIVDEREKQGKSDGKVRGSEIISRLDTPLELFDLKGQLDAFLSGEIKVGIDAGFFEIMKTIWSEELARTTVAKFNVGASGITFSSSISNSYINAATVFFDANFNGIWDEAEPITFTNEYGQYNLDIGMEWDKNDDGEINELDGQIIAVGGYDTSSGSAAGTFIGLPGSLIITPLTSLQVPLVQNGLTPQAADTLIKEQLGLDLDANLESFDSLAAVGQEEAIGLDIYLAHIEVHALFNQSRAFLDGLQGDNADANNLQLVQEWFAEFLQHRAAATAGPSDSIGSADGDADNKTDLTDTAATPYSLEDTVDIAAFFTFLAEQGGVAPTAQQVEAIAQMVATSNEFLSEVAAVGESRSLTEALPALASVKRVLQDDMAQFIQDFISTPQSTEEALTEFEAILYQNYTLIDADINAFGNRSVKVTPGSDRLNEGEQGQTEFLIELSHPAPNQGLTVFYSLSGTATLDEDYQVLTSPIGKLYIEPGSSSGIVEIAVVDDESSEAVEAVALNLQSVGEGYLLDPTARVAIVDIVDDEGGETTSTDGEIIEGGPGPDTLEGTAANDILEGSYADDVLEGREGDDVLRGGHGDDFLKGEAGHDRIFGNYGNDVLDGGAGNDSLSGGSEDDELTGGDGVDVLAGGTGDDFLKGNTGNDQLTGDLGNDFLEGNEDNDWLSGGAGNDVIIGGTGDDILNGGDGADAFFFASPNEGFDTILDFNPAEGDKIQVSAEGFGSSVLDKFRFVNGVLDFDGNDLALIQNGGSTYAYFANLVDIIDIVSGDPLAVELAPTEREALPSDITDRYATPGVANADLVTNPESTILDDIIRRGYIEYATSSQGTFFDDKFASVLAAALFGDSSKVQMNDYIDADTISGPFVQVANGEVDLAIQRSTHTSGRDASLNIDFSPLYLYDHQAVVVRKDSGIKNITDLDGKIIGVIEGGTAASNLQNYLEAEGIEFTLEYFSTRFELQTYQDYGLIDAYSIDSVLAHEGVASMAEYALEQEDYPFDPENHILLDVEFSKEPIAMALPENDSQWADVVRWVTYVPIQAEEFGINSKNIDQFIAINTDENPNNDSIPAIRRFLGLEGDLGKALGLPNDFAVNVIRQVGSYDEIFESTLSGLDRDRNLLWSDGGLLYSLPFSGTAIEGIELENNDGRDLLQEIQQRGQVRVGIRGNSPSFAMQQPDGTFAGFDIDLARALAAAVFGDADRIEFVMQSFNEGFANTANGVVDVSAMGITHNLVRDAALGIDYSPTYLYTGQGVLVRENSGINVLAALNGRRIGVRNGSTSLQNLENASAEFGVTFVPVEYDTNDELFAAYESGEIDAVSTDLAILATRIPTLSNPDDHRLLDEVLSKEPLALILDENQSGWADVVRWVIQALVQAEEYGITSENVEEMLAQNTDDNPDNDSSRAIRHFLGLQGKVGQSLGLPNDFVVNVIKAVGNYGEIYDRHFGSSLLRRDLNELYGDFGLQHALPFADAEIPPSIDNVMPVAEDDSFTVSSNSASNVLDVLTNDYDVDADTLTVVAVGEGSNGGQIAISDDAQVLTYTPAADFSGVETFSYTIDDGNGATTQGIVTVSVVETMGPVITLPPDEPPTDITSPSDESPTDIVSPPDESLTDNGGDPSNQIEIDNERNENDIMIGSRRRDRFSSGLGDDILIGKAGNDILIGGSGRDRLVGGKGDDKLKGGDDDDILIGGSGRDRLAGGSGNDILKGKADNDILAGGADNDRLVGGRGDDKLKGQAGDDLLMGGGGGDRIKGGAGNDQITGGKGDDIIIAGAGRDRVVLRRNQGFDRWSDFSDNSDRIELGGIRFNQLTIQQEGKDVLISLGNEDVLLLQNVDVQQITQKDFA
ncbi:MAG: LamG-like jellyroll fold domain-containing protein, partial [Elainellaceae cyanobacterium]